MSVIKMSDLALANQRVLIREDLNVPVKNGKITQGVFGDDVRFIDEYSGPASPLWSLRSLIIAYYIYSKGTNVFELSNALLPVEKESYKKLIVSIGITVIGEQDSGQVVLLLPKGKQQANNRSMFRRFIGQYILLKPKRNVIYSEQSSTKIQSTNLFYK